VGTARYELKFNPVTTSVIARVALCVMVIAALGCDKHASESDSGGASQSAVLDLSKRPNVLFEIFGEREDPRMIPIGTVEGGHLRGIVLDAPGWKSFDRIYTRSGANYTLYQDGQVAGTATVKQGMWEKPGMPLYSLPNCHLLTPLSAVALDSKVKAGITVEFLASGTPLPGATQAQKPEPLTREDALTKARDIAMKVGTGAGIPKTRLDSLDYHGLAINTGATAQPTLIASFIDPNAEEAAAHGDETSYVFVIADWDGTDYSPSFVKTVDGSAAHAEYRRYVDHLDIDGDGVDEVVIEGWRYGGDSFPIVLKYKSGHWLEIFHGASDWCLDHQN
jgi:hypothetical protein